MEEREAFTEEELLDSARSYLSEAFPNPERTGCPPDYAVRQLARQPVESALLLTGHLACCSPCFQAYMEHLGELKANSRQKARQTIWIRRSAAAVATAVVLIVALYLFLSRPRHDITLAPHTPASATPGTTPQAPLVATYVPVVIDLSNAAPQRGPARPSGATQVIPANSLVDLTLQLPVGSGRGRYAITLTSRGKNVWSGSAEASRDNGQIVLRTRADFTEVPAGDYNLQVTTTGVRLRVPLVLK